MVKDSEVIPINNIESPLKKRSVTINSNNENNKSTHPIIKAKDIVPFLTDLEDELQKLPKELRIKESEFDLFTENGPLHFKRIDNSNNVAKSDEPDSFKKIDSQNTTSGKKGRLPSNKFIERLRQLREIAESKLMPNLAESQFLSDPSLESRFWGRFGLKKAEKTKESSPGEKSDVAPEIPKPDVDQNGLEILKPSPKDTALTKNIEFTPKNAPDQTVKVTKVSDKSSSPNEEAMKIADESKKHAESVPKPTKEKQKQIAENAADVIIKAGLDNDKVSGKESNNKKEPEPKKTETDSLKGSSTKDAKNSDSTSENPKKEERSKKEKESPKKSEFRKGNSILDQGLRKTQQIRANLLDRIGGQSFDYGDYKLKLHPSLHSMEKGPDLISQLKNLFVNNKDTPASGIGMDGFLKQSDGKFENRLEMDPDDEEFDVLEDSASKILPDLPDKGFVSQDGVLRANPGD